MKKIMQSPLSGRFYVMEDDYQPGDSKHDVTPYIEEIISNELKAAWQRMGSADDPRNPGWFVCNSIEADQWEALRRALLNEPQDQ